MALTDGDFKALKNLMKVTIDESAETILATKEEIKHLPTKDDFCGKMDEVMGELKAMREEHAVLTHKVYRDHEERITKVEKKLDIQLTA